jgi:hypothetical protein
MKFQTYLIQTLAMVAIAEAVSLVMRENAKPAPHGVHSEFTIPGTDHKLQIMVPGHMGEPQQFTLPSEDFTQTVTYHPRSYWANQQGNSSHLEDRDVSEVCAYVTDCAGTLFDKASDVTQAAATIVATGCGNVANTVNVWLTNDNYGIVYQILAGAVINFAITLPSTVSTYYINLKLGASSNGGTGTQTNDVCGERDPATFAGNAASAAYQICLNIQGIMQSNGDYNTLTSNYDDMDSTSVAAPTPVGETGMLRAFISGQAGTWGAICQDYDITWKRMLARSLFGYTA